MHFFFPRDWTDKDCLGLAQVTTAGSLRCPGNGEGAAGYNGLKLSVWSSDVGNSYHGFANVGAQKCGRNLSAYTVMSELVR